MEGEIAVVLYHTILHTDSKPLDVTIYGPLKTAFCRESNLFIEAKDSENIIPNVLARIFNNAYSKMAITATGISGFKAAGIYLLRPSVFS
jgi:hypothetical protein